MEIIKNIFKRKKEPSRKAPENTSDIPPNIPVIEVSETEETREVGELEPILIKSIDLSGPVDVQEVSGELRYGNIVILDVSILMEEDPKELKRAIDQLKEIVDEIDGDIGRISETRIIATPSLVRIQFRGET